MAISTNVVVSRAGFSAALASRAHRLGSDETIQQLLELAEAKILAGGGEVSFLISGSGNGKTGTQESRMDAVELFTLAEAAIPLYLALAAAGSAPGGGEAVSCTYADLSGLSGGGGVHRLF